MELAQSDLRSAGPLAMQVRRIVSVKDHLIQTRPGYKNSSHDSRRRHVVLSTLQRLQLLQAVQVQAVQVLLQIQVLRLQVLQLLLPGKHKNRIPRMRVRQKPTDLNFSGPKR